MYYQYHILSNGIRIIHRQTSNEVAHCALMVNTGSRDEEDHENGIAHLIEHMIFKGTKKRKAYHVLSRLEHVGGELNAFTTKEETCIHASFTRTHYERVLELFADVAFNATFPASEIEKEKEVILDEINSYRDTPTEEIFDEFENLVFNGHPIGRNILGTELSIPKLSRNDIFRFISKNYSTSRMVLSSVGNISFDKLISLAQKYFGAQSNKNVAINRHRFEHYKAEDLRAERQSFLSHCIIGNIAYHRRHPRKHALILLNNILGGPGLNSRLYLNIREKYGFTYAIESHFHSYSDIGLFSIYLGTDPKSVDKTIRLVLKELDKLRKQSLGSLQLQRAKQQLIGQLAISFESGQAEMLSIARSHMLFERVDAMPDVVRRISNISQAELLEAANEVFDPSQFSMLIFKGKE
jgi:predicted Zn-dependent peptidase